MEILREKEGFIVSQMRFTLDMLQEFDVSHLPRVSSPLDPSSKLQADDGHHLQKQQQQQQQRPICKIQQYFDKEFFSQQNTHSPCLHFAMLTGPLARILGEAEYISMRRVTAELTWLVRLLEDLSAPISLPIPLHSDSKAAIHTAHNPVFHERTKHVELGCHFVRQQFLSSLITLSFIPSKDELEVLFTKPLSGVSHSKILSKLGVTKLPSNLRRDVGKKKPGPNSNSHGDSLKEDG
uniref:Uncharacterized protein LOC104244801 n=1 Tax=Nicotiana sylvestris TaxID=4096 RepID=A0A1U7YH80_NICSY|nr:PREDICTED: uncharacterized protein LOC104244801 [Nicotiana sylvestris]